SVYGIPALRRTPDPTQSGKDDVPTSLQNQPASRVYRDDKYSALKELDGKFKRSDSEPPHADFGFAVPAPFQSADIILTSVGGSFVANWQGEPPNLSYGGGVKPAPCGFSIERFSYWSQLGRDIRIEVVKKGYVLPLGQR